MTVFCLVTLLVMDLICLIIVHCPCQLGLMSNVRHLWISTGGRDVTGFRWDKADLFAYYSMTGQLLNDIFAPYELLLTHGDCTDGVHIMAQVDTFYQSIVNGLHSASINTVPQQKSSFCKFWWDEELSQLKENSINAHGLWTAVGNLARERYFVINNRQNMNTNLPLERKRRQAENNLQMS